jgi:hypothetical protein
MDNTEWSHRRQLNKYGYVNKFVPSRREAVPRDIR